MHKLRFLTGISLLLVTLISWNYSKSTGCSEVRNGKFFYYAKLDGRKVFIERKDSLQIETDIKKNTILKSKIIWIDSCKFKIYVNAFSDSKLSSEDSILATKAAIIDILSVTSEFYICNVNFTTSKKEYNLKDTMYFQK